MERRERCFRNLTFVLFTLFSLWISLQFLAPLAISENSVQDLSGLVAVSDNDYTINNMDFPWNLVYSAGDRLCHQKAERSFFVNDNQMPFCSRCTAIWLGLAVGLGFMVFYRIELNERFVFAILIGLVPIGADGVGQLLGFWESTNAIRVITGLLIGVLCGVAIGVIMDEIKTLNIFKNNKK
ncbi:putative membrane protein [Thermoplasmatales archaeon SCGC AB-540-F20]|nr:putative membrane protein [Thermoplasmatales archaeon SCGC AB-540-F20]